MPAKPKAAPQLTGPVQLDDDTRNALILFNARLVAQDELEREKRRVDKAAKAKDEAAAKVRQLENDPSATSDQKSEAQAAYLASLDALNRAKAGEPITADTPEADDENAEAGEAGDEVADVVDDTAVPDEPADAVEAPTDTAVPDEPADAVEAPTDTAVPDEPADAVEAPTDTAVPDEPADAVEAPTEAADEPDPTA